MNRPPRRHACTAGAVLLLLGGQALAHPHGAIDCAVQVGLSATPVPVLEWAQVRLRFDAAASQSLRPRVALEHDAAAPAVAHNFNRVLFGMLRQSGWMLRATPAGAGAAAVDEWDEQDTPLVQADPQGRVTVLARLRPKGAAGALSAQALQLECRDPTWYWLAGFQQAAQVEVAPPVCRPQLGDMQATRAQAQNLQASAQQAGAPGADQMEPALAVDDAPRAASATLRCDGR